MHEMQIDSMAMTPQFGIVCRPTVKLSPAKRRLELGFGGTVVAVPCACLPGVQMDG
jgi:hypothetical protein